MWQGTIQYRACSTTKINMEEKIKEFIKRRFSNDCNWTSGNCYFFAVILQEVFGGDIYYDVINGHFLLQCEGSFYDWTGKTDNYEKPVKWNSFEQYDKLQKKRIIRDCIK